MFVIFSNQNILASESQGSILSNADHFILLIIVNTENLILVINSCCLCNNHTLMTASLVPAAVPAESTNFHLLQVTYLASVGPFWLPLPLDNVHIKHQNVTK